MIEAVIFDLDGTLVNLPIDYERLIQEFEKVTHRESFHPLLEAVSKLDEVARGRVFKIWDLAELAAFAGMTINQEGMKLYKLYVKNPKALVTMQGKPIINTIIEKLGIAFDVILTREDSLSRAEQLKIAAQKLNASFEDILFVGNSENDDLAARQVMCPFQKVQ